MRLEALYPWETIKSITTGEYDESDVERLILHFENKTDVYFNIDGLEKNSKEIIDLMLASKGTSNVYYAGHYKK